ncbi:hypothetical protein OpiT1DRAFT_03561 [Opitutaceae bacterium TAV1]|nr:hypothetical protein OpiT1DRAFT_03561 [Opitutaceae bacterium TAV1]
MRTKVTLILVLLNVALFAFIFFFERDWRAERVALQVRKRVLGPESASIDSLTLTGNKGSIKLERIVERSGDLWMLTEPMRWPANTFAVSRIITQLQLLEHETSFSVSDAEENGQKLSDYGLETPALTILWSAPAATPGAPALGGTLEIGSDTAVGNRLYIRTGDRIHVVSRALADSLVLTLQEIRSDAVFSIPVFEVRSLNLQTSASAPRLRLRREQARWMFEAPIVARASKPATELAINDLNALRVHRFFDAGAPLPPDRTGLGPGAIRITLEGNNRRETLLLGNPVTPPSSAAAAAPAGAENIVERYARLEDREGILFSTLVPGKLADTLREAQTALRDKNILDLDTSAIVSVTIASPQSEITLQHLEDAAPDAGWQVLSREGDMAPRTVTADGARVARLVQELSLLKVEKPEQFVNDAPSRADIETYGFNLPERTVTLACKPSSAQPATSIKLELGHGVGDKRALYARVAGQPFIYEITPEILNTLSTNPLDYRERTLQILPPDTPVARLALRTADGATTLYEHTLASGETWEKALASEPGPRRDALAALLAQIPRIQAKTITHDSFPDRVNVNGRERPWAWKIELTPASPAGNAPAPGIVTLFIAERSGGTTWLLGSPNQDLNLVFEAPQPLIDALWALLYADRDPGPQKPAGPDAKPDAQNTGEPGPSQPAAPADAPAAEPAAPATPPAPAKSPEPAAPAKPAPAPAPAS